MATLHGGLFLRDAEKNLIALLSGRLLDRTQRLREERVANLGNNHTEELAAPLGLKGSGEVIGHVTHLRSDAFDALDRLGRHVSMAPERFGDAHAR